MPNDNKIDIYARRYLLESIKDTISERDFDGLNHLLKNEKLDGFDSYYQHLASVTNIPPLENVYSDIEISGDDISMDLAINESLKKSRHTINSLKNSIDQLTLDNRQLKSQLLNIENIKNQLVIENKNLAKEIHNAVNENESLKKLTIELQSKVQQNRIDEKIPGYVDVVKNKLQQDDKHFIKMSYIWAGAGITFAILSIISAFITFFLQIDFTEITSIQIFYYFTRGLLGISLLTWLSYYCLSNSKKYTHESIRRKDRQHAMMFGEVFLQIYGSTANKQDAIDVFKDWNMSGDSAFSDQIHQPPSLQSFTKSIIDKVSSKNHDKEP